MPTATTEAVCQACGGRLQGRWCPHHGTLSAILDDLLPLRAREAPCCTARRDADGRLPIGYCGPDCVRRRP